MSSEKYKAQTKWQKKNTKRISVVFFCTSEQDMIDWVGSKESANSYVKGLIRADMEKHKG